MATLSRQAFARLMAQVEEQEDAVDECEAQCRIAAKIGDAARVATAEKALGDAREALRKYRDELTRISDGCGHPHHH